MLAIIKSSNRQIIKFLLILFLPLVSSTQPSSFHNPALDLDFPDPTVIKAPDGKYYAYATQAVVKGKMLNLQVASSKDLFCWEYIGEALPVKPSWASQTQNFWAPHVLYDSASRKYIMFYSGQSDDTAYDKCIGIAFSDYPAGPFTDGGVPLIKGKGFLNIDPMAFVDPVSGKKFLYWGSGFGPLYVRQLTSDWKQFAEGSLATPVLFPGKEKEYTNLVEGAWVDFHSGKYYLYYSGDNCCGEKAKYAVMIARADYPTGPFEPLGKSGQSGTSVILAKDAIWTAPGHNSLIRDEKGNLWMAYHAVWRDLKKAGTPADDNHYLKRVMCLNPVIYQNGWPIVQTKY